jgi:hypothetical protein
MAIASAPPEHSIPGNFPCTSRRRPKSVGTSPNDQGFDFGIDSIRSNRIVDLIHRMIDQSFAIRSTWFLERSIVALIQQTIDRSTNCILTRFLQWSIDRLFIVAVFTHSIDRLFIVAVFTHSIDRSFIVTVFTRSFIVTVFYSIDRSIDRSSLHFARLFIVATFCDRSRSNNSIHAPQQFQSSNCFFSPLINTFDSNRWHLELSHFVLSFVIASFYPFSTSASKL